MMELRYKNESNPRYKFITQSHCCSNTDCKHYDPIKSCKKFKSCNKSIAYIKVLGLESEINQLMKLLRKSNINFYGNKSYPSFVYHGKHFRFIIVNNNTINNDFEKYCNKFQSIVINGKNPFI